MMRRLSAHPLSQSRPEELGLSPQRLARIDVVFNEAVDRGRIPGAVIAVARRGRLAYLRAFGYRDPDTREPMGTDAIFSIASMTKPLTTVAALILFEQAQLFLLDPVEKYLPSLAERFVGVPRKGSGGETIIENVPARRSITIQDLMRHTSGLTYGSRGDTPVHKLYPPSSFSVAATMTAEQFLTTLKDLPLLYHPGTAWEYGFSTDVLGLLVEAIAKQSLASFLQEHLFEPLGMHDTSFVIPRLKADRYAKAFNNDPNTNEPQSMPDATEPAKFECGGAGAVSTAGDYLRFVQMLLNKGELEGTRVLGRKTVELMTSNHLGSEVQNNVANIAPQLNGYGFGLGVAVRSQGSVASLMGSVGEFTWPGVFGTYFWADPREELAVVFLSHTPGSPEIRLYYRQAISTLVLQAVDD